jgi:hypothetical protein
VLRVITRRVPDAILKSTRWLSEQDNPPSELPGSYEEFIDGLSKAGKAADDRARAAAPAAGLLGTIAGLYEGVLKFRPELVVLATITVLLALFAQSARLEANPGDTKTSSAVKLDVALHALRRKEAYARLAGYFSGVLGVGLIFASVASG